MSAKRVKKWANRKKGVSPYHYVNCPECNHQLWVRGEFRKCPYCRGYKDSNGKVTLKSTGNELVNKSVENPGKVTIGQLIVEAMKKEDKV